MPAFCKCSDGEAYSNLIGFRHDAKSCIKTKSAGSKANKIGLDPFKGYRADHRRERTSSGRSSEASGQLLSARNTNNNNDKQYVRSGDRTVTMTDTRTSLGGGGLPRISGSMDNTQQMRSMNMSTKYTGASYAAGGMSGGYSGGMSGGYSGGMAGGISGGMAGGMSGGMAGGMSGGMAGGISGGTAGGMSGGMAGGFSGGVIGGASGGMAVSMSSGLSEKEEMNVLNARLLQYIHHMREKKGTSHDMAFGIEEEIVKFKTLYEKELSQSRTMIEKISRDKRRYEVEWTKYKEMVNELQTKLNMETGRSERYLAEVNSLKQVVAQKELLIEEGRIALVRPAEELQRITVMYQQILHDYEQLKLRFENEQTARHTAEDKYVVEHKAVSFQKSVNVQERKEIQMRLEKANQTIVALEERVRGTGGDNGTVLALIQQVKVSAEQEFVRFKQELQQIHDAQMTELRVQVSEDDRRITNLKAEIIRLNEQIAGLLTRSKEFEGQISGLVQQKDYYVKLYEDEKTHASAHVRRAELKLKEMQEVLVTKLQELTVAREAQVSLKAEIASFRLLIEEEERRLNLSPVRSVTFPALTTSKISGHSVGGYVGGYSGGVISSSYSQGTIGGLGGGSGGAFGGGSGGALGGGSGSIGGVGSGGAFGGGGLGALGGGVAGSGGGIGGSGGGGSGGALGVVTMQKMESLGGDPGSLPPNAGAPPVMKVEQPMGCQSRAYDSIGLGPLGM